MTCTNELGLARARATWRQWDWSEVKDFPATLGREEEEKEWERRRAKNLVPVTRGLVWEARGWL